MNHYGHVMLTGRPRRALLTTSLFLLAGCSGQIARTSGPEVETTSGNLAFVYAAVDTLFAKYVTADRGLIDYESIYQDTLLERVRDSIAAFDLSTVENTEDSLAFWINAYNILVIYHLRDFGLTPQDRQGFPLFSKKMTIAGEWLTLDELEKSTPDHIKRFDEPRTHFVLVCAALSCPPLMDHAYRGDSLYRQLDRRTHRFINDSRYNSLGPDTPVKVSEVFRWYVADFEGFVRDTTAATLLKKEPGSDGAGFIAGYVDNPEQRSAVLEGPIGYTTYDWTVNKQ